MADGKLVFPVKFDLQRAVADAQGDIDKVLRQMQTAVNSRPLKIHTDISELKAFEDRLKNLNIGKEWSGSGKNMFLAAEGSIASINAQMDKLIQEWQKLAESERVVNRETGEYTDRAKQIIQRYAELTGASRTYAKSLDTLQREADKAVRAQEKDSQAQAKRIAKSQEMVRMLNAEELSLTAVAQKMKFYQDQASKHNLGTKEYQYATQQLERLGAQYERLKLAMNDASGNKGKDIIGAENIKRTLRGAEDSIEQVKAKLKALDQVLATTKQGSFGWNRAAQEAERLNGVLDKIKLKLREIKRNDNQVLRLDNSSISNMNAKLAVLQRQLQSAKVNGSDFQRIAGEIRKVTQELEKAQKEVDKLTGKSTQSAQKQHDNASKVNRAYQEQSTYLSRLFQRMVAYASVQQIGNFLTKVREVTAQFELQRVSLGAIINDQVRANQLFTEIKQFALKSPVKIMDLTKYTKQLAAYRIETDKLFDTTKRLADVAVGLGGNGIMERLILAYGETKASHALNAKELRQYAMMGIPMLELLSQKLTEIKGKAIDTHETFEMIKKRLVEFDVVKQVFEDLTNEGGMFYDMQEKQGNTLYGMWAKLGDAASVMYDEIGNTSSVNSAMKGTIQLLSDMMRNWRDVSRWVSETAIIFGVYKLAVLASTKVTALSTVWNTKDIALRQMHLKTIMAQSRVTREFNRVLLASGVSANAASTATWTFSRALHGLKSAIATTGIGALIIALGYLIDKLLFSKSASKQLEESLENIETESVLEQDKSVRNFERLANTVVSATSTYKQQQSALEELRRTYKDIIPVEQLTIENLKSMHGNYELLTSSIRKYIAERMKQKQIDEITNTYGRDILILQRKINDDLKNKYSYEQITEFWKRYTENIKDSVKTAGKSIDEIVIMTVNEMGATMQFASDLLHSWSLSQASNGWINMVGATRLMREQEKQVQALTASYESDAMAMGEYAKSYQKAVDKIEESGVKLNGEVLNKNDNPLIFAQQEGNLEIKDAMVPTIKEAFASAGIAFDDGWVSLKDNIDKNLPQVTSTIDFDAIDTKLQEESKKMMDEMQKQADVIIAQREAILKQIQAEEGKGKGGDAEKINQYKDSYDALGVTLADLEEKARKITILPNLLKTLKAKYENLVPSDSVVKMMRQKFDSIVDYTKGYAKNMRAFRMNADEDLKAYRKRLTDEVQLIKDNIKAWTAAMVLAKLFRNKTEEQNLQNLISEAKLQLADLEKMLGSIPEFEKSKSGKQSDPRLQTLQEIANKMAEVNKEYDELLKKEGQTKALADTQKLFASSFKQMQETAKKYKFKLPTFEVPQTIEDVQKWYKAVADEIKRLGLKNADKVLIELGFKSDKSAIDKAQKEIEQSLKDLADRISRTKTAKEFYDKILSQTGDKDLALKLSVHIYGEDGTDLFYNTFKEIQQLFQENNIISAINFDTESIDYNELVRLAEGYLNLGKISDETYNKILKMRDDDRKDMAKTVEGWIKATEKAKTYSDKLLDLRRTTQTEIDRINKAESERKITSDFANSQREGFLRKEAEEIAKLQYEAFKDSPMYVQMFDDLDHASTTMLRNMKQRLTDLQGEWKNLDPKQLKEMQSRLNEIDKQLATRNPFSALVKGIKDYRKLQNGGEDGLGPKSSKAADKALDDAAKARIDAEKKYLEVLKDEKSTADDIEKAKNDLDRAMSNEDAAAKAVENWKKVKDTIGLSANELFQMLNWAGDIAKGIADISEAMGADQEDVQYWNDIASALGEISGGIQDIVQSAMSGNVVGIISSAITAIPKMFVGFANLFSAGRIKRANKEIKRQQELLDQLEYTYGRLEKAAEKAFGGDFINNFKQQQKNLQAQAVAYQKQLDAEKSKGKKADKEKIKEYENAYRDTMDKIADMQNQVANQMLGTDLTSAARDFAQAWLDAYKEFGKTSDKMSEKFHEMIQNMVVEGALAKVMERALQPMFDMIDNMGDQDFYNETFWKNVVSKAEQGAKDADYGAQTMMKFLEKAGISMRDLGGELTGISRDIAGASEESINGLAAAENTRNFYIAQMLVEVQGIHGLLQGGTPTTDNTEVVQWKDWQGESMENIRAIERHTAETVAECKRAADRCEQIANDLHRTIDYGNGNARLRVKM